MATYDLTSITPSKIKTGDILNCPYSGDYKTILLPKGRYKLECWGAAGGTVSKDSSTSTPSNYGGYAVGTLNLKEKTDVYIFSGGAGSTATDSNSLGGGYNGGGNGGYSERGASAGGGGSSDIRLASTSLYARVLVAGGAGGDGTYATGGAAGMASTGSNTIEPGTGAFFYGSSGAVYSGTLNLITAVSGGGGGGWYGGGAQTTLTSTLRNYGGSGGTSYVYTAATASDYPSGCLLNDSYYLTDAITKNGNESFIDYNGNTVTGCTGNGYVRITVIEVNKFDIIKFKATNKNWIETNNLYVKAREISSAYSELEYIKSSGTQYIDTGFIPNQDTRVVCDVVYTTPSSSSDKYLFGARQSNGVLAYGVNIYNGVYQSMYNTQTTNMNSSVSTQIIIDKDKNVITVNGTKYTQNYTTFACPVTMYLFALNNNGTSYGLSSATLYSCKIYDNKTLIRNYIPCKKGDSDIGLYDTINNQFYSNAGTGVFTAGPVVANDSGWSPVTAVWIKNEQGWIQMI